MNSTQFNVAANSTKSTGAAHAQVVREALGSATGGASEVAGKAWGYVSGFAKTLVNPQR
jgi:hypothetical protein